MTSFFQRGLLPALLLATCGHAWAAPTTVDAGAFHATYDLDGHWAGFVALGGGGSYLGGENLYSDEFAVTAGNDTLTIGIPDGKLTRESHFSYSSGSVFLNPGLSLQADGDQPLAWRISLDTTVGGGGSIEGSLKVETPDGQVLTLDSVTINHALGDTSPRTSKVLSGLVPAGTEIGRILANFKIKSNAYYTPNFAKVDERAEFGITALHVQAVAVPEPSSVLLMLAGGLGLGLVARKTRQS